ncbi:unnamed protein product [Ceutorhynchus assimilis]|uniref:FHA domain-containing protein n=1 Tax=Ceutorhynchus assimilis TaxID=467358 RepID=A0A9N9MC77_9CUCU|nr:unnamed protein product [Ceutorhynchus assimilis]
MVFILRHVQRGDILVLGHNMEYAVGRSRRNHIIVQYNTVDNIHAVLTITNDEATIEDLDTKFGTRVNGRKIKGPFKLRNGDVVTFGANTSCKYAFLNDTFEVQLDKQMQKCIRTSLINTLKCLNIKIVEKFNACCSHYVIEKVTLDSLEEQSIFKYLINKKTVITPKYFEDILANIEEAPLLPNLYRYMPEIDQYLVYKGIEDIPRVSRRYLFEDVICVFFNKACEKKLCSIITKCGGHAIMYTRDKEIFLERINYGIKIFIAVIHNSNGEIPELMNSFSSLMKEQKLKIFKTFSVMDIYTAVLRATLNVFPINVKNNNDSSIVISDNSDDNPNCDLEPINSRISSACQNNSYPMDAKQMFVKNEDGWITRERKSNCQITLVSNAGTNKTKASPTVRNSKENYNSLSEKDTVKTSVRKDAQKTLNNSEKNELVIVIDDDDDDDKKKPMEINSTCQTAEASRKKNKSTENETFPSKRPCLVINPFSRKVVCQKQRKSC